MGLLKDNIAMYWRRRAREQGLRTVGLGGASLEEQDGMYAVRRDFIFKHCPTDLETLDYGCGIGRYADMFRDYEGQDITGELIDLAKQNHPDKKFVLVDDPSPQFENGPELFFTSTVLQHCDLTVVAEILHSLKQSSTLKAVCLYENAQRGLKKQHVIGRTFLEYAYYLDDYLGIKEMVAASHVIHGERHDLLVAQV
jgi:SAM-dependent methyltransferase